MKSGYLIFAVLSGLLTSAALWAGFWSQDLEPTNTVCLPSETFVSVKGLKAKPDATNIWAPPFEVTVNGELIVDSRGGWIPWHDRDSSWSEAWSPDLQCTRTACYVKKPISAGCHSIELESPDNATISLLPFRPSGDGWTGNWFIRWGLVPLLLLTNLVSLGLWIRSVRKKKPLPL